MIAYLICEKVKYITVQKLRIYTNKKNDQNISKKEKFSPLIFLYKTDEKIEIQTYTLMS